MRRITALWGLCLVMIGAAASGAPFRNSSGIDTALNDAATTKLIAGHLPRNQLRPTRAVSKPRPPSAAKRPVAPRRPVVLLGKHASNRRSATTRWASSKRSRSGRAAAVPRARSACTSGRATEPPPCSPACIQAATVTPSR